MFTAELFITVKMWEQPRFYGQANMEQTYRGVQFSLEKKGSSAMYDHISEPWGQYGK